MRAHCFQHEPFEGMASIETWLKINNFDISFTHLYNNEQTPKVDDIDWLIIMGGAMSINDEVEFPWLVNEKIFIRQCIDAGKVVIGICLGSQLIASSLGSKIYPNTKKEIGWFPIEKISNNPIFSDLPQVLDVFHWHGETYDLPQGAELVASSKACKNQIFTYGKNVVAFQCHLETTYDSLNSLSEACQNELIEDEFIQSEETMKKLEKTLVKPMQNALFAILDKLMQ